MLKVTSQVVTSGAKSAFYDCLVNYCILIAFWRDVEIAVKVAHVSMTGPLTSVGRDRIPLSTEP